MPQSLVKNHMHITFSTKDRLALIDTSIEKELYNYLGGICRNLECYPIVVGGHRDHIHILCLLSRKIALMNLIEELKTHSSKWIKAKGTNYSKFYWQRGYGGFSVGSKDVETIREYIMNQSNHHKKNSFQEEYRALLEKYQIDFDERYVWD